MFSKTSQPGNDQLDEVAEPLFQSPTLPEDQSQSLPFPGSSYMEENDFQLSSKNTFFFQPILKEEGPGNQQPDYEHEIKTIMEIENVHPENPKEDINISKLSPENQVPTGSTNPSTPEIQQVKHNLPTFPNLNTQPECPYVQIEDKKEDETGRTSESKEPWEDQEKWNQILDALTIELQNESVKEGKSSLLAKTKKICKETRTSTNPKSKRNKKSKNSFFSPQILETADVLASSSPGSQEIPLEQADQIETEEEKEAEQDVSSTKPPERSSQYTNRIQLITKHFYYPFSAQQNAKTAKDFYKVLEEALDKYQIDSSVMEHYLIVKRFKLLFFKVEFAQHGFEKKSTSELLDVFMINNQNNENHGNNSQFVQNCLVFLKNRFQQIGWNVGYVEEYLEKMRRVYCEHARSRETIIRNYLTFRKFKKIFKNESSKNGTYLSDHLRYEIFTGLFGPLCHEYNINQKSVEEHLVSEIKGVKEGVSKNGNPSGQAKILNKIDLEMLLCPTLKDSGELIMKKAGSQLGLEIFFREGFYERWVRKIWRERLEDETKRASANEVADFFIKEKENIFREFLPQLASPRGNTNYPFVNN